MTTEMKHATLENFPMLNVLRPYLNVDGAYIAGGCFKHLFEGKRPRDLDMYFPDEQAFDEAKAKYLEQGWEAAYESKNAVGVKKDGKSIDLVKFAYKPVEEMLGMFDFTITKFALRRTGTDDDGKSEYEIVHHPDFFEHLTTKRLVIDDELRLPINTFQRMFKYTRYGYNLCRESKIKLLIAIRDWDPEDENASVHDELEDALQHSLYEAMD